MIRMIVMANRYIRRCFDAGFLHTARSYYPIFLLIQLLLNGVKYKNINRQVELYLSLSLSVILMKQSSAMTFSMMPAPAGSSSLPKSTHSRTLQREMIC